MIFLLKQYLILCNNAFLRFVPFLYFNIFLHLITFLSHLQTPKEANAMVQGSVIRAPLWSWERRKRTRPVSSLRKPLTSASTSISVYVVCVKKKRKKKLHVLNSLAKPVSTYSLFYDHVKLIPFFTKDCNFIFKSLVFFSRMFLLSFRPSSLQRTCIFATFINKIYEFTYLYIQKIIRCIGVLNRIKCILQEAKNIKWNSELAQINA